MINLEDFIKKYEGVANSGNTPENKGECVGLIALWVDNLELSHIWGHAKDIFANASPNEWDKIENSPDRYPEAGDIMLWGSTWGGGYGHTGVVESSSPSTDSFICFEQNYPIGNPPKLTTRKSWNGIIGWLHPKGNPDADIDEVIRLTQQVFDLKKKLDDERDEHVVEIRAKDKIIGQYEKQVKELTVQLISARQAGSTATSDLKELREQFGVFQTVQSAYKIETDKKIDDLGESLKKSRELVSKRDITITELRKDIKDKLKDVSWFEFIWAKIRKR